MGKKKYNGTRNSSNAEYKAISGGAKALSPEIIKESGDKAQAENQTIISEEKAKYDSCYNNILWIDDMDDNQAGCEDDLCNKIEWMQSFLKTENDAYYINLINKFSVAVKEIVKNCNQYDLVVFDMDLSECDAELKDENIRDVFKTYNLNLEGVSSLKYGGLYLYLLLLSVGYPINRMVFYSANMEFVFSKDNNDGNNTSNKDPKKDVEIQKLMKAFFNFNKEGIYFQEKSKGDEKKLKIEQYFLDDDNSYYRIRRLVFQACEYWKNHDILKDDKTNIEVPFNNLYNLKIEKNNFREMLDHIEMLFPVKEPSKKTSEVEKVYYQAAKTLCMFHEESAKITKIGDDKKYKKYHQVSRYFRNWSAHNKFDKLEMEPELFALLFCITLRTYFDAAQTNTQNEPVFSELYDYENLYYNYKRSVDIQEKDESKLVSIFNMLSKKIKDFGNKKYIKKIIQSFFEKKEYDKIQSKLDNIDSVIRAYGESKNTIMTFEYLLYGTVFETDKIKINCNLKYELTVNQNELTLSENISNCSIVLSNSQNQPLEPKNILSLKSNVFDNGSDFEKLVFLNAYKILTTAPAQPKADNSNTTETV